MSFEKQYLVTSKNLHFIRFRKWKKNMHYDIQCYKSGVSKNSKPVNEPNGTDWLPYNRSCSETMEMKIREVQQVCKCLDFVSWSADGKLKKNHWNQQESLNSTSTTPVFLGPLIVLSPHERHQRWTKPEVTNLTGVSPAARRLASLWRPRKRRSQAANEEAGSLRAPLSSETPLTSSGCRPGREEALSFVGD